MFIIWHESTGRESQRCVRGAREWGRCAEGVDGQSTKLAGG